MRPERERLDLLLTGSAKPRVERLQVEDKQAADRPVEQNSAEDRQVVGSSVVGRQAADSLVADSFAGDTADNSVADNSVAPERAWRQDSSPQAADIVDIPAAGPAVQTASDPGPTCHPGGQSVAVPGDRGPVSTYALPLPAKQANKNNAAPAGFAANLIPHC